MDRPNYDRLDLGQTYPHAGILPDGDTLASHLTADGLFILGAFHNLTERELDGFRTGTFRVAVGRGNGFATIAVTFPGANWSDSCLPRLATTDSNDDERLQATISSWLDGGHAMVRACLVDRDAADAVAALRMFTLSPHVTQTLARVLNGLWEQPPLEPPDFIARAHTFQSRHPNTKTWVNTHALAICKSGD